MIRQLKIITSLLVIVFMFLPLSECSHSMRETAEESRISNEGNEKVVKSESRKNVPIAVIEEDFLSGFVLFLTFLLPLFTSVLNPRVKKWRVANSAAQFLAISWLTLYAYIIVYGLYTPLLMGHLFMLVCAILMSIYIVGVSIFIMQQRNKSINYAPSAPDS